MILHAGFEPLRNWTCYSKRSGSDLGLIRLLHYCQQTLLRRKNDRKKMNHSNVVPDRHEYQPVRTIML